MLKKLTSADKNIYFELLDSVVLGMKNPDWFIYPTEEEKQILFDDNKVVTYGFFEQQKLVGISSLSLGQKGLEDVLRFAKIDSPLVAEVGLCATSVDFRGNNIMLKLNQKLVQQAKQKGLKFVLATAHPNNVASNTSLNALGMKLLGQFLRHKKFLRNVWLLEI